MRPEGVVLHHITPVCVDDFFTLFPGSDAVLPMIVVRKAASRPPQYRQLYLPQGFHHITPHALYVPDIRGLSHINSFIDSSAQMLGKLSVQFPADFALSVPCIDDKLCHILSSSLW